MPLESSADLGQVSFANEEEPAAGSQCGQSEKYRLGPEGGTGGEGRVPSAGLVKLQLLHSVI